MSYVVALPDGTTAEFPDEVSEAQAAEIISRQFTKPAGKGGFKAAFGAGVEGLKGAMYGLAGRTGAMDVAEAEAKQKGAEARAKAEFTPTTDGWTESPWEKTKELMGGSLPYMAAPVVAGAAATVAGAPAVAAAGLAGLASATQFTATNIARQTDKTPLKDTDLSSAVLAAIPQAALDMIGLGRIPGVRQLIGAVAKDVGTETAAKLIGQSTRQIAADYAKATGKAMGAEGVTEAGQQVLERLQAGLAINDPEARKEYWDSFVGGAVLGGALSPAGRYMERSGTQEKQQREEDQKKTAADLAAQQKAAADAEQAQAEKLADPTYLDELQTRAEAFNKQRAELAAAVKAPVDQNDPVALAERQNAKQAMATFMRDEENKALLDELAAGSAALRKRQAEKVQAEQDAQAQKDSELVSKGNATAGRLDLQGGEGSTPLTDLFGNKIPAEENITPAMSEAKTITGRAPDGSPIFAVDAPEVTQHPATLIQSLTAHMERLQEQNSATTDLARKAALGQQYAQAEKARADAQKALAALPTDTDTGIAKLQKRMEKATEVGDVATSGKLAQQILDLQKQGSGRFPMEPFKSTTNETDMLGDRAADLKKGLQQVDTTSQHTDLHEQQAGLFDDNQEQKQKAREELGDTEFNQKFQSVFDNGESKKPAVEAPATVGVSHEADAQRAKVDALAAAIDKAHTEQAAAQRAGEKSAAQAAFQRGRSAMAELDALSGSDPYTRELIKQKYAQQEALNAHMDAAERIRQGQYLGYKFGKDKRPEGLVKDLVAQIEARLKARGNVKTKGELERINTELTVLREQLNRARSKAEHVGDKDQTDLASTTLSKLHGKADDAAAAYTKAMLEEAATHRAARGQRGITHDEAIKAADEIRELMDLRRERKDGEKNDFIRTRLKEIADKLGNAPGELSKTPAELINTQYAPVEAAKTAEARGETATTLSGELRRRSEYVQNLLEKAMGRAMPDDVRAALTKAQESLQDGKVTRDLLEAAEVQANRVLDGRMKGTETTYSRDPSQRGRGVGATDLAEEPQYPRAIHDALAAMKEDSGQPGLFDAVNNKDAIKRNETLISEYEAEIADLEKLRTRLGDAAERGKTNIRPAAERMVETQNRIDALRKTLDNLKQSTQNMRAEEVSSKAAASEVDRLGTPEQTPQIHEPESGFVPDSQSEAFGKPEQPLATGVLGYIRATAANFAKSPMVVKMREAMDVLRGTTDAAKARANMIEQYGAFRKHAIKQVSQELEMLQAKLTGHEWLATAYPKIEEYFFVRKNNHTFLDFKVTQLHEKEFNEVKARLGIEKDKARVAKLLENIAEANKIADEGINRVLAGDPATLARKRKAEAQQRLRGDISEQEGQVRTNVEEAIATARADMEKELAALYDSDIAPLEGKVSGLEAQLQAAQKAVWERLENGPVSEALAKAKKAGSFSNAAWHELASITRPIHEEIQRTLEQIDILRDKRDAPFVHGDRLQHEEGKTVADLKGDLHQEPGRNIKVRAEIPTEAVARAHQDPAVKEAFKKLQKLQDKLAKAEKGSRTEEEAAARKEVEAQQLHAEELRRIDNEGRDAAYKARNEEVVAAANRSTDAHLAQIERRIATLDAQAKTITGSDASSATKSSRLTAINEELATLHVQQAKLEGRPLGGEHERVAGNESVDARRARLEAVIADENTTTPRRANAQESLDALNRQATALARANGPTTRTQSAAPSTLRSGKTEAATAADASTAPEGYTGKGLSQSRASKNKQTGESDNILAARLRLKTATEKMSTAIDAVDQPGLRGEAKREAQDAVETAMQEHDAATAALEAEQARGKMTVAEPKKRGRQAKDVDTNIDAELQGDSGEGIFGHSGDTRNDTPLSDRAHEAITAGDTKTLLEELSKAADPEMAALAEKLSKFVKNVEVGMEENLKHDGVAADGIYNSGTDSARYDPKTVTTEVAVHELAHAATIQVLHTKPEGRSAAQNRAVKLLTGMYEAIKNNPAFKGEYAKKSLDEFVAEVYARKSVRAKLDAVGKPQTMLQRIVQVFKDILHLNDSQKAMRAIDKLLTESSTPGEIPRGPRKDVTVASASKMESFGRDFTEQRSKVKQLYDVKGGMGLAVRQGIADMRASLREVLGMGAKDTGIQAQASLLTADGFVNNAQSAAAEGAAYLHKDKKGIIQVLFGGSKSGKDVMEAIAKIPAKDAEARLAIMQGYLSAKRAEQHGWHTLDTDNTAVTEAKGKAALAEIAADPAMKAAVEHAHDVYRDLNRGMIDFLDKTHALPKDVIAKMRADKNYVPFFRENGNSIELMMPDGHPQSIGDIRSLPFLQALKGDNKKLMSFPDAMLRNISTLTNLGVMNLTNRQIGYHMADIGRTSSAKQKPMQVRRGDGGAKQNVLRWHEAPDPAIPSDKGDRYIEIDTRGTIAEHIPNELLVQATAGSYATFPAIVDVANTVAGILRTAVTRNPMYLFGQLFKDPFNASMEGNLKANPVTAVLRTMKEFGMIVSGNSPEVEALRKSGALPSNIYHGGKSDLNKIALQMVGDQQGWIKRGLAGMDRLAMAADAATRVQAYKEALKSGASESEAALAARELANFGRHGSYASVQFFSKVIPFFNSSIQGLDVFQRSARGQMPAQQFHEAKAQFYNRAMGLAAMAMAYSLMMEDDPEWEQMSLRDKMSYIHIPRIFGEHDPLRLPAPFETGMLFYSMPIAMMEALKGNYTKGDWKTIRDVFLAQMPGSGSVMPLLGKGYYDVSRNRDSNTGQKIVPKSMEGLDPVAQYTKTTSEVAKRLAEQLNAAGVKLSSIELEYLTRTYLGSVPMAAATMTNSLFKKEGEKDIAAPEGHQSDIPLIGRLFQNQRGANNMEHMFEMAHESEIAADTFNNYKNRGKAADAKEYLAEHKLDIALAKPLGNYIKTMSMFKKREEFIREHKEWSSAEKQKQLDELTIKNQQFNKQMREQIKAVKERVAQQP